MSFFAASFPALVCVGDRAAGALPRRRRRASRGCCWRSLRSLRSGTWGEEMRMTGPRRRIPHASPT